MPKKLQWWQLLLPQGPVYEVKVPNSDGYTQCKNPPTPSRTRGINTTHQYFQMRYIGNIVMAQEAQKLSAIKFQI